MRKRRKEIQEVMTDSNEAVFSMSTFPRLGCEGKIGYQINISRCILIFLAICKLNNSINYSYSGFTYPEAYPDPETSFTRSLFWPSEGTFHGHPRFKTLTQNIRERRGEKVKY